jgi:ATP-binding protein involved in chromosome partitioning
MVVAEPESSAAKTYKKIARLTAIKVSKLAQDYSNKFPNIVIQKT